MADGDAHAEVVHVSDNVLEFPDRRPEPMLTTKQLIEEFARRGQSSSLRWWRYRIAEEDFPKHRWGRQWRFRASEVQRWMEDQHGSKPSN